MSPMVNILTLVQYILSCTCTFFSLFHAVWSKAWHWAMGLEVRIGEGREGKGGVQGLKELQQLKKKKEIPSNHSK